MIFSIIGGILMVSLYLVTANAVRGPGGDQAQFEQGKKNAQEFIEVVTGDKADQ